MKPALQTIKTFPGKCEKSILEVLAYFDMFSYPLTSEEVQTFLPFRTDINQIEYAISRMVEAKVIYKNYIYFSLHNDRGIIERRITGNARAQMLLPKAERIARFLYRFPYVRAVAVSGSLSKNFADKNADIDFFIIAKQNRLWIARTIMHLYKKFTFITGRQHFYCMNYYIDETALEIREKNIYTAIEVVTLLPMAGSAAWEKFFLKNYWTNEWFPYPHHQKKGQVKNSYSWIKRLTEYCFNNRLGNAVDNFLFKWSAKRWNKKEARGNLNMKGNRMKLVTGKHFAKSDPGSFQEKILSCYSQKLASIKQHWPEYFL